MNEQANRVADRRSSSLDVLVTGMHRSGTSALGTALAAAGLSPGESAEGWSPTAENPLGFAERRDVVGLNDRLLQSLGWTWSSPPATPLAAPPERLQLVDEGRALVAGRLAPAKPWFVKDPRLSLLLPWWRQILLDRFVAVVTVRPPHEVAWSLSVRNGFPIDLGLALWAAYHRHLARGLEGLPVVVVDYVSLTEDPATAMPKLLAALERAGVAGGLDVEAAAAAIHPTLRRATAPDQPTEGAARAAVERLAAQWSLGDVAHIESFRMDPPDPAAWEESILQVERGVRREEARAAEAAAAAAAAREDAHRSGTAAASARRDAEEARREADELRVRHSVVQAELEKLRRRAASAERRAGSMSSKLGESRGQRDLALHSVAQLESDVADLRQRISSLEALRQRAERAARDLRAELAGARTAKIGSEAQAAAAGHAAERLRQELLDERRARIEQKHELEMLSGERSRAEAAEAEVTRLAQVVSEAQAEANVVLLSAYRAAHDVRARRRRWRLGPWWRPLFDGKWYASRYSDVPASRLPPLWHFARHGRREGRDPNALFDGRWYLSQYHDVAQERLDPLHHYIHFGVFEGRDPSEAFSTLEYLRRHPDVVAAGLNPVTHALATINATTKTSSWRRPAGHVRAWSYLRRYGAAAFVNKLAATTSAKWHARHRRAASLAELPPENMPDAIHASLDLPGEGAAESSIILTVAGWACAATGIRSITLFIDGVPAGETATGLPRADVADAFPAISDSARAGFSTTVRIGELDEGEHELGLAIEDATGHVRVLNRRFQRVTAARLYHGYYERMLPTANEVKRFRRTTANERRLPKLTLWVDARGPVAAAAASATLASVAQQEYRSWRCAILVDETRAATIESMISELPTARDPFTVVSDPGNLPALDDGYLAILRAGETLAPHALFPFALAAGEKDATIVYSDHDAVEASGRHVDPRIAPDYSPDHLLSRDYVGGFFFARATPDLRTLAVESLASGRLAWRFELLLRLLDEEPLVVAHVPRILWSEPAGVALLERESVEKAAIVDEALRRRGVAAEVTSSAPSIRRVRWQLEAHPKVSIIIPTTGRMDHLRPCVSSLLERTRYESYELLFIDNGRGAHPEGIAWLRSLGLRVLERNEPFNWAKLNNDGARETDGELLLFLNDDVEVRDGDWLTELVAQAVRPGVGSVGPLLLFPDGMIQHAGIFLVGHGGGAMHFFHHQDPDGDIYQNLQRATREVAANTGACLMVRRELFEQLGGFDVDLAVVGNDVDLCLRLLEHGYRNVWTPHSVLIHHESVSRGALSIGGDESKMWDRWSTLLRRGDPYFSPHFAQDRPDCVIAWDRAPEQPAHEGAAPTASQGANLIGYIRAEMGVGQATRGDAQALTAAGVPFVIIDYSDGNPSRMGDQSWLHKVATRPAFDINLVRINADWIAEATRRLGSDVFDGRYNIGCWAWELGEFPDRWRSAFDVVDEVWAPSKFVQEAIAAKSPVPVIHIPHAVAAPPGPFRDRAHFALPEDRFQFLMMYDVHSLRQRKNPEAAIQAFVDAFDADDESVSLVIKVNNGDRQEEKSLRRLMAGRSNVFVIDRTLDREEVDSLLAASDCYVSLHRSEGFGLPIAEAMALAKPVIATHWSGNVDFMNEDNAACVGYELTQIAETVGPYDAGQWWAEPDVAQASDWMRRLAADRKLVRRLGERARETVERELSPARVGRLMAERIAHIRSARALGSRARAEGSPEAGAARVERQAAEGRQRRATGRRKRSSHVAAR